MEAARLPYVQGRHIGYQVKINSPPLLMWRFFYILPAAKLFSVNGENKTPSFLRRRGHFLGLRSLFYCFFESSTGAEFRYRCCRYVNHLAGARIAGFACRACLRIENPEVADGNFITLFERVGDCHEDGIHRFFCLFFCSTELLVNEVNNVCFFHKSVNMQCYQ